MLNGLEFDDYSFVIRSDAKAPPWLRRFVYICNSYVIAASQNAGEVITMQWIARGKLVNHNGKWLFIERNVFDSK